MTGLHEGYVQSINAEGNSVFVLNDTLKHDVDILHDQWHDNMYVLMSHADPDAQPDPP